MDASRAGTAARTDREPTINERLNRISERLQEQCDRFESVLSRVNGSGTKNPQPTGGVTAQIHPTLPLVSVVEHLEAVQSRFIELACAAERIA